MTETLTHGDAILLIVLCVIVTLTVLLTLRLPAALIIAGLAWFALWKLGVL